MVDFSQKTHGELNMNQFFEENLISNIFEHFA